MHIPDGFLDVRTAAVTAALAAGGLAVAVRQVRLTLPPRRMPLLGLASAFLFAAQMINFPVAGGTSGHLLGGVMAAVLLGPAAAVIVMSAVLFLQCLLFSDGGVTALGANLFNMALLAPVAGFGIYRALFRLGGGGLRARLGAIAVAAWCSTLLASLSCALQLATSGVVSARLVLPAMAGIHALIGLGEAVITVLVISAIVRARPELLEESTQPHLTVQYGRLAALGLVLSLGVVFLGAPWASQLPDGLEWVAEHLGFEGRAGSPVAGALMPDYVMPGLRSEKTATILAGSLGVLAVFLLVWALGRWLKPVRRE